MKSELSRRRLLELITASGGAALSSRLIGCGSSGVTSADGGADAGADSTVAGGPLNILMIVVDQERYGHWMASNTSLERHDKLVAQGTTFSRHYATAMPCTPSRSVIYTGQHVQQTKMVSNIGFNQESMAASMPTMGTYFKEVGYKTAYLGKWHLSEIDAGSECSKSTKSALGPYGFDEYNACGDLQGTVQSGYNDDPDVADWAAQWLSKESGAKDQPPWFLAVNFVNPHDIMFYYPGGFEAAGPRTFGFDAPNDPLYKQDWKITLPSSYNEDLSKKPPAQQAYSQVYDAMQAYPPGPRGLEAREKFINYYVNCLRDVDRNMGKVLDALAASRFANNTLIIFTADHGELAFAHGMRGKGPCIYEENNHVPLVLVGPGVQAGRTVSSLSCHLDLVPTLLALAGQKVAVTREKHPALRGVDLTPCLADPTRATGRAELLMTFDFGGTVDTTGAGVTAPKSTAKRTFLRGITDGRYKFARYFESGDYTLPTTWEDLKARNDLELYDTQSDADEVVNLGNDPEKYRTIIEDLNSRLNALITTEAGGELPSAK